MKNNEKPTARPTRSFLPATFKPIKTLHFRGEGAPFIGEIEPSWPTLEEQRKWTREEYEKHFGAALTWYSQTQEDKTIIELAFAALGLSGHFPELVVALKNSTVSFSITAARLLRMTHAGFYLRFREKRFIVNAINKSLNNQKESAIRAESLAKPQIQDYLNVRVRKVRGEIDSYFDTFMEEDYTYGGVSISKLNDKKPLSLVSEILKEPETSVPANRTKDLVDYCQKYLDEYRLALSGRNDQITEAYAPLGKRKIKASIAWWEQAISDINIFAQQKQSMRKTRKRKPKSPTQLIGKLKFLKTFPDLKLESIDPTQVLKCAELWIYNTRLRKIGHYVALNDGPFEVKGTRLTNIDTGKSVQKTLRKPAEQLKEFSNYSKPGVVKWFNKIRAVATPLRESINGDSILLKGIK